ncbi:hypothetical protein BAUCODRAFT_422789 [Baudoinia panamericana UAMH 10762]|uniref:Natural resistance-associated macrophage protein n=1 Tax=Baudoinia panamericana (strain UAMH 10762) TaxID=717646 RepID=M2N325_BAUPA|nr:uncharacterized protein BAUCODRAFT_422789 [Baudoinia panamericana UAMH 10762]EMC98358.1 hypothetical protein BAUCODRAFT_422789 [Baudoinia panamericana UAMH 10762]
MNCPSRTEPEVPDAYNQSPNALSADLTTRSDLGRIASARLRTDHRLSNSETVDLEFVETCEPTESEGKRPRISDNGDGMGCETGEDMLAETLGTAPHRQHHGPSKPPQSSWLRWSHRIRSILVRYAKFVGPGFMISVAYIDPGNYATDVAAGASYRFKLLFMVLLSNLFAIYLQSLCIKLGSVTGLNLAEMCKAHLPCWLNYTLYVFAEAAIIATDIAEVIGTAIALNLLSNGKLPLVAGCAISIVDVLFILLFYRPNDGSMRALRAFEIFVMLLVLGVVVCFCVQLSLIRDTSVVEVFRGYLPSSALVQGQGLYQACGILGATVMPHSLYLGSGIIQARLKEFDQQHKAWHPSQQQVLSDSDSASEEEKYRPSLSAIKSCMSYSIVELAFSLFAFALFVNSAILIVAGASLSDLPSASDADLFGIYHLLSTSLAPAAGTIFALALLLSGMSAGIVCTIAGQMVSEGQLSLNVKPWVRRLITRSISITPSIIIAGAVGQQGLSRALEASQVALSVILPFVSAPLIYFTCRNKYMTVSVQRSDIGHGVFENDDGTRRHDGAAERHNRPEGGYGVVQMRNHWVTAIFAVLIWGVIVIMNVALLVLLGLGVQ